MFWRLVINNYDRLTPICTRMPNIKTISIQSNEFEKKEKSSFGRFIYLLIKSYEINGSEANDTMLNYINIRVIERMIKR